MGGVKLSVHPLFFLFGIFYALSGKIFLFAVYTVSALIHEIGHSFVASGLGYKLNNITLMPFGAVVSGNIEGLKLKDQIKIALAGPFINLGIGLLTVAIWWLFPTVYAFTDVVAQANFSLALINLLPIFPLDGGRVVCSLACFKFGNKKGEKIVFAVGMAFFALLFLAFICSLFASVNFSLLFFSAFVLFSLVGKIKENRYIKCYNNLSEDNLKRGMPVKIQAVDKSMTIKKLLSILDDSAVNYIYVYSKGKKLATLNHEQIKKILENCDLYSTLSEYV